ncbi:MAG: hypothetical protein Q8N53_13605 [Longimicrobiales bacterium]|nr:hypothetical protein [Longimicrobiales bacterium]
MSRGYATEDPEALEESLRLAARTGAVISTEATEWGTKYYVVGEVIAPDGNPMTLGTVWFVSGEVAPVLVTAYPTWR